MIAAYRIIENPYEKGDVPLVSDGNLTYDPNGSESDGGGQGPGDASGGSSTQNENINDGQPFFWPSDLTGYTAVFDKNCVIVGFSKELENVTISNSDNPTFLDYAGDVLQILGGAAELGAVYLSDGTLAPFLESDGADRVLMNTDKIINRVLRNSNKFANALPGNLLGSIGAVTFGIGTQQQQDMENLGDLSSLAGMGFTNPQAAKGLIGDFSNLFSSNQNLTDYTKTGVGVLNGIQGIMDGLHQLFNNK